MSLRPIQTPILTRRLVEQRPPKFRKSLRVKMFGQIVKQTATKMGAAGRRGISASAKRMSAEGEHHQHLVFEGDFPKGVVLGLTLFVTVGGVGVPVALYRYQNWKHGFPQQG
ncbi:hypothetical protein PF006_g13829 [Phytophthora fragariae]|uniref:Uncharacterized protein n=1 Tax=Phytophthora fragariae TaxID=53985 RepID=A0A6A3G2K7_9STRA|nr:hypothetical protein PF009_g2236 [Phytophthora fragariae]KAE9139063.1 hypothetical protein PF006_g13829 [Phytophthora fragariae]